MLSFPISRINSNYFISHTKAVHYNYLFIFVKQLWCLGLSPGHSDTIILGKGVGFLILHYNQCREPCRFDCPTLHHKWTAVCQGVPGVYAVCLLAGKICITQNLQFYPFLSVQVCIKYMHSILQHIFFMQRSISCLFPYVCN